MSAHLCHAGHNAGNLAISVVPPGFTETSCSSAAIYVTIWLWLTVCHGKIHPFSSSVNHLFLWAIYTMAMLNNQRVKQMIIGYHWGMLWENSAWHMILRCLRLMEMFVMSHLPWAAGRKLGVLFFSVARHLGHSQNGVFPRSSLW